MRSLFLSILFACKTQTGTELTTRGKSLTFAYEDAFGFEIMGPFGLTYGDRMNPNEVKNWAEILDQNRSSPIVLEERESLQLPLSLLLSLTSIDFTIGGCAAKKRENRSKIDFILKKLTPEDTTL